MLKQTVETGNLYQPSGVDDNDQPISVFIAFGMLIFLKLMPKQKLKIFKLQFKDCAGIPNKKHLVKLTKRATCEGAANDGLWFCKRLRCC